MNVIDESTDDGQLKNTLDNLDDPVRIHHLLD